MPPEEKPYSPFERTPWQQVSEEDMVYLRGEPAPLKVLLPVTIEDSENIGE